MACAALLLSGGAFAQEVETLAVWTFENGDPSAVASLTHPDLLAPPVLQILDPDSGANRIWPAAQIVSGRGEGGGDAGRMEGFQLMGVIVTNLHPTEPFFISEIRFSLGSVGPEPPTITFLISEPGGGFLIEIDDGIIGGSGGTFVRFSFPLELLGPDALLAPRTSMTFAVGSFEIGGALIDNIELTGSGPDPPVIRPDTEISPISTITRTAAGTELTMPVAIGRNVGVEYSTDLSGGSWIELGNFFEEDGVAKFLDPDPVRRDAAAGFYRAFLRPLLAE